MLGIIKKDLNNEIGEVKNHFEYLLNPKILGDTLNNYNANLTKLTKDISALVKNGNGKNGNHIDGVEDEQLS